MKRICSIFILSWVAASFVFASESGVTPEEQALLRENGITLKPGEKLKLFVPAESLRKNSEHSPFLQIENKNTCMAISQVNTKLQGVKFQSLGEAELTDDIKKSNKEAILSVLRGEVDAADQTIKGNYKDYADFRSQMEKSKDDPLNPLILAIQEFQDSYKIRVSNDPDLGLQLVGASSTGFSTAGTMDWNTSALDLLAQVKERREPFSLGMMHLHEGSKINLSEEGHAVAVVGYIEGADGKVSRLLVKDPNFPKEVREASVSDNKLVYNFGDKPSFVAAGAIDFDRSKAKALARKSKPDVNSQARSTPTSSTKTEAESASIPPLSSGANCAPKDELSSIFQAAASRAPI